MHGTGVALARVGAWSLERDSVGETRWPSPPGCAGIASMIYPRPVLRSARALLSAGIPAWQPGVLIIVVIVTEPIAP